MDTTDAKEVLDAFAQYAKDIEEASNGAYMPQLVLYGDGSGLIRDIADGRVFLDEFDNLSELYQWLQGELAEVE